MGFPRVDMLRFREDDATDPTDAPFGVPYGAILHPFGGKVKEPKGLRTVVGLEMGMVSWCSGRKSR